MEREEREQIPWSQLAADVDDGIDRRWYLVGVSVGIVVVAILGFRLVSGGSGQPDPSATPMVSTTAAATGAASSTTAASAPIVTEDALRAAESPSTLDAIAVAEWFVMDLYTVDGSPETVAAVRDRLDSELAEETLAHDDPEALRTFVEWARAFDATIDFDSGRVAVAYRMIRDVGGSYERDPVEAVVVRLARSDGRWVVSSWPEPTPTP